MLHQSKKDMTEVKARAIIPRDTLKRATALLNQVIERRNTIPILGYLRFEIRDHSITITGTDLDIEMSMDLEAETDGAATVMVAARVLAGLMPIAAGPITLTVLNGATGDLIQLSDGETEITLNAHMPADEYPDMKHPAFTPAFTLSQDQMARLFRLSRHCISTEETRYYLNGVFLTSDPERGTVRSVATDGHRLACIDTDEPVDLSCLGLAEQQGLIVQRKSVEVLLSLFTKGGNEPVQVAMAPNFIKVTSGPVRFTSKTIDGTYPDYARVIPPPSQAMVVHLSGPSVKRAAALARTVCNQRSNVTEMDLAAGRMTIQSPDGNSMAMPLQGSTADGSPHTRVGFNIEYLRAQGAVTPTFTLSTASAGDPARIVSDDPNALWVLMPMRV